MDELVFVSVDTESYSSSCFSQYAYLFSWLKKMMIISSSHETHFFLDTEEMLVSRETSFHLFSDICRCCMDQKITANNRKYPSKLTSPEILHPT